MITVIEAAESNDLVCLESLKAALGICTTAEDAALSAWIAQASAAIASEANTPIVAQTYRQTYRLQRYASELFLHRWPVQSISSITIDDEAIEADEWEHNQVANTLRKLRAGTLTWWPNGTIIVTYQAGYPADAIPDDLQRAAVVTVQHYRARRDPMLRSSDVVDVGVRQYLDWNSAHSLPPEAMALVARHRVPSIG